jgi:hypothetical protein
MKKITAKRAARQAAEFTDAALKAREQLNDNEGNLWEAALYWEEVANELAAQQKKDTEGL